MEVVYIYIYALLLLFGRKSIVFGKEVEDSRRKKNAYNHDPYFTSCYISPFESLEVPGSGSFNVHKGHRLIPVNIPEGSELCDDPMSLFEPENEIWDNNTLVPKDFEDFSELIEEVKNIEEDKDTKITSKINELLKESEKLHAQIEPPTKPEQVMQLHTNEKEKSKYAEEKNTGDEFTDDGESSMFDDLSSASKTGDLDDLLYNEEVKRGIGMRIFMFVEFCRDNLARNGLPLNIINNSMYTEENFKFFGANWSFFGNEELVFDDVPYQIWQGFVSSGILTTGDRRISEEAKRRLVLSSLNEFFNGLEKYYSYNINGNVDYKYYLYLESLGIDEAIKTIKYYRDSIVKDSNVDTSLENLSDRENTVSTSSSSISTSSMYVPSNHEPSVETSATKEESVELSDRLGKEIFGNELMNDKSERTNSYVEMSKTKDEPESRQEKPYEAEREKAMVEARIKWFRIFTNEYLGRIGIGLSISEYSCNNIGIYNIFKNLKNEEKHFIPDLVWSLLIQNGFDQKTSDSLLGYDEKREIIGDLWFTFNDIEGKMFGNQVNYESYNQVEGMMDIEIRDIITSFLDKFRVETSKKLIKFSEKKRKDSASSEYSVSKKEDTLKPLNDEELADNLSRAKKLGLFNLDSVKSETNRDNLTSDINLNSFGTFLDKSEYDKNEINVGEYLNKEVPLQTPSNIQNEMNETPKKTRKNKKSKKKRKRRNRKNSGINQIDESERSGKNYVKETALERSSKAINTARELAAEGISNEDESSKQVYQNTDPDISNSSPFDWLVFGSTDSDKSKKPDSASTNVGSNKNENETAILGEKKSSDGDENNSNNNNNEETSDYSHSILNEEVSKSGYVGANQLLNQEILPPVKSEELSNAKKYVSEYIENNETSDRPIYDEQDKSAAVESTESVNSIEESPFNPSKSHGNLLSDLMKSLSKNEDEDITEEETEKEESEKKEDDIKQVEGAEKASFKDKLSGLLQKTKSFFGFGKNDSKKDEKDSMVEEEIITEYENLTKLVVYFIQSYAALRYKFVKNGVLEDFFDEAKEIVRESFHFHQGTTEFDSMDLEKGVKKIAGMLGGGSFTAIKALGLTARDISSSLKKYLLNLFPTGEIEEIYKKNKKTNTTGEWLKKYFKHNLTIEEMLPRQLERPSITEESSDLIDGHSDSERIIEKADLLCEIIITSIGKYTQESKLKGLKKRDLDCLAVAAANQLHNLTLSNSIYLFLFKYNTNLWKYLTQEIALSLSKEIKK
ncbi:hypothetical protein FG386_000294 [Cryptosporidium ryanae]|uniref:uncharacterized protein n=1 Tax=Cryptosporidium ryanae TaxID=515981 RepID=UPI003519DF40|nr:hypothetical protein FG386_000294 [Cryptosporidium ryanae]